MEQVDRALRAGLRHWVKIGDRIQIEKIYDWGCGSKRYDSIFYFLIWQEHRLYQAHAQYKTLADVMAAIKRWRPDLTNIDIDCEFRSKLDSHSTANWTLIPRQTGH